MPRLCLINPWKGPCPPDGFRWVDPSDGWVNHAWDYGTWLDQAFKHFRANEREIPPDLGEEMQEQLCMTLPPGWCAYDDPGRPRASASLGWDDLLRGVETFSRWIKEGMFHVEQKEADRRALICSRCYLNVPIDGCSGCQAAVAQVLKGVHTKYDFTLRGCAVCKCVLKAKVHFPLSVLDREHDKLQEMYPGFCWLKRHGPNYSPLPD